jgi:hypothetical protein
MRWWKMKISNRRSIALFHAQSLLNKYTQFAKLLKRRLVELGKFIYEASEHIMSHKE